MRQSARGQCERRTQSRHTVQVHFSPSGCADGRPNEYIYFALHWAISYTYLGSAFIQSYRMALVGNANTKTRSCERSDMQCAPAPAVAPPSPVHPLPDGCCCCPTCDFAITLTDSNRGLIQRARTRAQHSIPGPDEWQWQQCATVAMTTTYLMDASRRGAPMHGDSTPSPGALAQRT